MANVIGDKKNYVHWFLGSLGYGKAELDDTNNEERYKNIMSNFIKQTKNGNYAKKIVYLYKKNLSDSLKFNINHWKYFAQAANDLILSKNFLDGLDTSFQSLVPLKTMSYYGITGDAIKKAGLAVGKLSDLLNGFDHFVKLVLEMNSSPGDFFKFLASQTAVDIPQDVRAIFDKLSEQPSQAVVSIYENTIKSVVNREDFTQIKEYGAKLKQGGSSTYKHLSNSVKNKKMSNEDIASFVNGLNSTLNQLAGFVHEALITGVVNIITPRLLKQSLSNQNVHVEMTGSSSAKDQSLNFSTNTMDLKITEKNASAELNVYIPSVAGATVKRKGGFDKSKNDINIKTKNSSLEKLLHLANAHGLWNANTNNEAFYNIMADHRRHTSQRKTKRKDGKEVHTGSNSYYYYSDFDEMTKAMNKMFLIFGLAGGMTPEDFSTHLIVNNMVFSIVDILAQIGSYDVYPTGGLTESFQTKIRTNHEFEPSSNGDYETLDREAGKRRSSKIIDFILEHPISLNLVIRHQMLRNLKLR